MDISNLQTLKNRYDIVGTNPKFNRALEISVAVAPTDLTVLFIGESGTGKEVMPRIIHDHSLRRTGKYFAVNCGAIPEGTIDSELFGHEKGAFTGATEMRKGYFEEADGGTLFLDEIAELPLTSQAKLLRVLQDGEFIRVGSSKVMKTDVRVVAATNVDLKYAVQRGRFRADLYYRLCAVTVNIPPLRERQEDIPLLFRKFSSDYSQKYGTCKINLAPDAAALLQQYRWPGNIRQLKNVAETVSALESSKLSSVSGRCEISAAALSAHMPDDGGVATPALSSCAGDIGMSSSEREAFVRLVLGLKQEVEYMKEEITALRAGGAAAHMPQPLPVADQPVDRVQQAEEAEWQDSETDEYDAEGRMSGLSMKKAGYELIRQALERHGGNRREAAEELGIAERTLYRKIKEMYEKNN